MIVATDPKWNYGKQLTFFCKRLEELLFAIKPFETDKHRHCTVKKNSDGHFAVFVIGLPTALQRYQFEVTDAVKTVDIEQELYREIEED